MRRGPVKTQQRLEQIRHMKDMLLDGDSYQTIGDRFAISRQRVQQLVRPHPMLLEGVKSRAGGRCEICGIKLNKGGHIHHINSKDAPPSVYNSLSNMLYVCISCHRREHRSGNTCRVCGRSILKNRKYCSPGCRHVYRRVHYTREMTCTWCGETFRVAKSAAKQRTARNKSGSFYCSKHCQGKWLATHYGFGVTS